MPDRPTAGGAAEDVAGDVARADAREEMQAAPPFLTWSAIYLIVLGALAAQVVVYAVLTAVYR
jgi:hypothetical protein